MDDTNKELTLEDIGGYTDTYSEKHFGEKEITSNLKKSAKQIETWIAEIDDPSELYAIHKIAKEMDLPSSKMKLIEAKIPDPDMFDE